MNLSVKNIDFETYRPKLVGRLRAFLFLEREKFTKYITVLEKQREDITCDDSQTLLCHQELGDSLLNEISVLEKSVRPLWKDFLDHEQECPLELVSLKEDIEQLRIQALELTQENRTAIESALRRLDDLLPRVKFQRNPRFSSGQAPVSRFINISA